MVAIYTKRKKCHIAFQFTKSYVLQANEKELFKTYPKLTKKYPDSQLEYTGGSAKITQTLNWNIQDAVYLFEKMYIAYCYKFA